MEGAYLEKEGKKTPTKHHRNAVKGDDRGQLVRECRG